MLQVIWHNGCAGGNVASLQPIRRLKNAGEHRKSLRIMNKHKLVIFAIFASVLTQWMSRLINFKNHCCEMRGTGNVKKLISLLLTAASLHGFFPEKGSAQIYAGSAFLKTLPGARIQSMAGASAAVLDDPHTVFANAGTAGFLREWQWAAGYSKRIADISNVSLCMLGASRHRSAATRVLRWEYYINVFLM
jgi:hypothetical protein